MSVLKVITLNNVTKDLDKVDDFDRQIIIRFINFKKQKRTWSFNHKSKGDLRLRDPSTRLSHSDREIFIMKEITLPFVLDLKVIYENNPRLFSYLLGYDSQFTLLPQEIFKPKLIKMCKDIVSNILFDDKINILKLQIDIVKVDQCNKDYKIYINKISTRKNEIYKYLFY